VQPTQILESPAFDAALDADRFLLFKHSLTCPISARAFRQYTAFLAGDPKVATGWIDVVGQRPWSQRVEAKTGVAHESPQALVLSKGKVVWHASHGDITKESLERATAG
jgi:bacillithiol system protein YtxJ